MQYRIQLAGTTPDLGGIEQALQLVDPAALVDVGSGQQVLRVAAAFEPARLLTVLGQAGLHISAQQVERVASECCGGCGG